jgi:RNA polymerase sigma factor (sigma-70 family)
MESDIWAFAAALAAAAPACPDREAQATEQPPETSAESAMISGEERREVMEVLRRLPSRQREALVLRFYLDLDAEEIAATMGISPSTVRSATYRALVSLGRMIREES